VPLLHSTVLQEYNDHSEKNLSKSIQNIKNDLPLKCIVGRISLVVCLQHLVLSFREECLMHVKACSAVIIGTAG
jgi:hypothetical protein